MPVEPSRRVRWLLVLLVLGLTLVAYLPALKAGFVNWDDDVYLLTNTLIRELSAEGILHIFSQPYYGQYQPLVLLSFAFDYHFAGLDPAWYHTVNVLLHVANTGLVLVLVRALSGRFDVAVMAAAIFGVHPLHVESVAWVTERKDLLYGFFYLASLIAYVNYIKRHKRWLYAIALALFLLSLLSKAQAVTLVLTLPLVDWLLYRHRDLGWRWIALEKIPFFVSALAFGSLALVVQGAAGGLAMAEPIGLADRVVYGSYNLVHHLMRLFAPVRLSAIYPNPTQEGGFSALEMLLYPSLVLILIWLAQRSLRHTQGGEGSVRRGVAFGLGLVVVNVLPMLQFIPAGTAMMNDRFAYISSIGFCYLVGVGLGGLRRSRITIEPSSSSPTTSRPSTTAAPRSFFVEITTPRSGTSTRRFVWIPPTPRATTTAAWHSITWATRRGRSATMGRRSSSNQASPTPTTAAVERGPMLETSGVLWRTSRRRSKSRRTMRARTYAGGWSGASSETLRGLVQTGERPPSGARMRLRAASSVAEVRRRQAPY
ncbi:MAG: hypothetical protein P8Y10_08605 [Gemmatimonadales bacterium]